MWYNFSMETTMSGFGKVRHLLRSSILEAATFNPENMTVDIKFRSGSTYRYGHITPDVFLELTSALYPGVWFARKFPVAYINITGSL